MDEITYLNTPTCTVTSSRIVIGAQTFATRNVGSVSIEKVKKPSWPWLLGVIGLAMMATSLSNGFGVSTIIGSALACGSGAVLFSPAKLKLKLNAGGGEVIALTSTNASEIDALHRAIVTAISAR